MFIFLKKNTANPDSDVPIHPASPVSPPNLEDTLRVTGEHLPENTAPLYTPPSEDADFGEEKRRPQGQDRGGCFNLKHFLLSAPHHGSKTRPFRFRLGRFPILRPVPESRSTRLSRLRVEADSRPSQAKISYY